MVAQRLRDGWCWWLVAGGKGWFVARLGSWEKLLNAEGAENVHGGPVKSF